MSDTLIISGRAPAWLRFADFQGPSPEEERAAIRLADIKGKQFKRGQRNVLRGASAAEPAAGQWGGTRAPRCPHYK